MITILLILCGAIAMTSLYVLATSITHAPEGFEDEAGFHFGSKVEVGRKPRTVRKSHRVRASIGAVDLHQPVT